MDERYEDALERAKIAYKDEDRHLKAVLERIFPVLKKSEDEKIRKELISMVQLSCTNGDEVDKFVSWIYKQRYMEWSEEDLVCLGYLADFVDKNGDKFYGNNKTNVVKWIRSFADCTIEHKPIDTIIKNEKQRAEDKEEIERIINCVRGYGIVSEKLCEYDRNREHIDKATIDEHIDWLKSSTLYSNWIPSDEQMSDLWNMMCECRPADQQLLQDLYYGLRKLRGDD